jgi:hypothetical protein
VRLFRSNWQAFPIICRIQAPLVNQTVFKEFSNAKFRTARMTYGNKFRVSAASIFDAWDERIQEIRPILILL